MVSQCSYSYPSMTPSKPPNNLLNPHGRVGTAAAHTDWDERSSIPINAIISYLIVCYIYIYIYIYMQRAPGSGPPEEEEVAGPGRVPERSAAPRRDGCGGWGYLPVGGEGPCEDWYTKSLPNQTAKLPNQTAKTLRYLYWW
jgi:hypothetical protein